MWTKQNLFQDAALSLTPQELIDVEHTLKEALAGYVSFDSYSLFFPKEGQRGHAPTTRPVPEYRVDTKELILPLVLDNRLLGYFLAKGVRLKAPRSAPVYLAALATATLEKLALYKKSITDPLTGLFSRDHFFDELDRAIDQVRECIEVGSCQAGAPAGETDLSFSGTMGVIFMDLDRFQRINERYGYLVGDDILAEIGHLIQLMSPKYVTASRFANDKFAILVPDAKPRACFQLAEMLREGVGKMTFTDDITGDIISISASLGYVNYPQGLEGAQFKCTPTEQARIITRKARRAVSTAKDLGRNRVFGYSDILRKGGKILEMLPLNRMAVSLGDTVGAEVGQRFLVSSPRFQRSASASITEDERISGTYPAMYKGEVVLIEVQEEMAFAETLHVTDAAWKFEPGDRLKLIVGDSLFETNGDTDAPAVNGEFLSYKEFINIFTKASKKGGAFGLFLTRILDTPGDGPDNFQDYMDEEISRLATLTRSVFGDDLVCGRFGLGGLIHFLPGANADTLRRKGLELTARADDELEASVVVGGTIHPLLDFKAADALDNCRKGLDHALLLDEPRVAICDSVSLNLAADQLFMEGDIYGAVEEFKRSLLLDQDNAVARNSLGICYAQLGKFEEARKELQQVVDKDPGDVMALYNLGWANHRLGELDRAEAAYLACLKIDPEHFFSHVRLGTLAEQAKRFEEARSHYLAAKELPGGEQAVLRPLARVAYALDDLESTREYLHLALSTDHHDHQAMHMLARLYMESGQDPQIAEVLSRQASALAPGNDHYRDLLAQTLKAQGKDDEARTVESRAN